MKRIIKLSTLSLPALLICITINSQNITSSVKPGEIWPDTDGKHINAHGGGILYYNNTYYWFGEARLVKGDKDRRN
jgi:hypothetical protein